MSDDDFFWKALGWLLTISCLTGFVSCTARDVIRTYREIRAEVQKT